MEEIEQLRAQLREQVYTSATFNERLQAVQNELLVVMLDRNRLRDLLSGGQAPQLQTPLPQPSPPPA